ncbi:phosphoribosylamine--glycine ligase, partial [Pasteurella multocida subsp. multocida str. Anand1_cattle]
GDYRKGDEITGIESAVENQKVFLAGVENKDGKLVTNGGRVVCVTALGDTVYDAQQQALALAEQVKWTGRFYRRDIGYRAVA